MAPKGGLLPVLAGVAVGTVVSFLVAAVIIKRSPESEDLEESQSKVKEMKAESKGQSVSAAPKADVKLIVFACDAGMGSSAMGESILKKALKDAGIDGVDVKHSPVDSIPSDADVVFTQESLVERAKKSAKTDTIIPVKNFLDRSKYDEFISQLKK